MFGLQHTRPQNFEIEISFEKVLFIDLFEGGDDEKNLPLKKNVLK